MPGVDAFLQKRRLLQQEPSDGATCPSGAWKRQKPHGNRPQQAVPQALLPTSLQQSRAELCEDNASGALVLNFAFSQVASCTCSMLRSRASPVDHFLYTESSVHSSSLACLCPLQKEGPSPVPLAIPVLRCPILCLRIFLFHLSIKLTVFLNFSYSVLGYSEVCCAWARNGSPRR